MKLKISKIISRTLVLAFVILPVLLMACASGNTTPPPAPTPTPTTPAPPPAPAPAPAPGIKITSPADNAALKAGDVTVSVQVSDFTLINNLGKANIPGEGHIHYFMDVDAPTTPGKPAVTAAGTYAASANQNHTWSSVSAGTHTFSAELINNDHTPLVPPVIAKITLTITAVVSTPAPTPTPTPPPAPVPGIAITSPASNSALQAGNIAVSVQVFNFNVVNNLGKANASGEGHIHYFLDADAPTAPGKPAVTAAGTYAATTNTSYTWPNVAAGTHTLSAELINNDHTPLVPPVVAKVTVTVTGAAPNPTPTSGTIDLTAQNFSFDKSTITVVAGTSVTVNFSNKDGVPHNFALYTNSSASTPIFVGTSISGPSTTTYRFTAPAAAGTYFFRCDTHPTNMTGSFTVTAASTTTSNDNGGSSGY